MAKEEEAVATAISLVREIFVMATKDVAVVEVAISAILTMVEAEEVMVLLLVAQSLMVAGLHRGRGQHTGVLLLQKILILVMVLPDLSGLHKGRL